MGMADTSMGIVDASTGIADASMGTVNASIGTVDASMHTIDASMSMVDDSMYKIDASMYMLRFSFDSVSALLFHPYDIICVIRDTFHLRLNPLFILFHLRVMKHLFAFHNSMSLVSCMFQLLK